MKEHKPPKKIDMTVGALVEMLQMKDQADSYEIHVLNNPGDTETGSQPDKIVVMAVGGDTIRLN